jgi:DNA-binding NtrC family response regulator
MAKAFSISSFRSLTGAGNLFPKDSRPGDGPVGVLLVSPNSELRHELQEKLRPPFWELCKAGGGAEGLECLHENHTEILLLDPMLPDLVSSEFGDMVRERFPAVELLSINSDSGHIVLGSGSPTPLSTRLAELLYSETKEPAPISPMQEQRMRAPAGARRELHGMIGESEPMQRVYELAHLVAQCDTTVLITGESGTGKDVLAQEIHLLSSREKQPLVVINCAAIPEALLEAELFGYVKGSFTGALQSRIGRIPAAHGGTLFLDEIGDMPLSLQSKILRFLEQGEVQRIGGNENLKVDVRVIAATNAELPKLVEQKLFREDLYYRLAIFPVKLPPLRERGGDVKKLAEAFVARFCRHATISEAALAKLQEHPWPGNVRELRNVLERCSIVLAGDSEILPKHILL